MHPLRNFFLFLWLAIPLQAAPSAGTYDSYHIGNSHTDTVRNGIKAYAQAVGKAYDMSSQTIPGASLLWNYNNPGAYPGDLAPSKAWEAVVFQIYGDISGEAYAAQEFYRLALAGNPQCTVYLYNVFPNKDAWNTPPYERTLAAAEQVADAVAAAFPSAPTPRIVPVGDLLIALSAKAVNGEIPGITSHYDFFASAAGDSHLNSLGQYVAILAHLACFFREDIRNYPNTITSGGSTLINLDPATGTALRAAAWDYLQSYARTGINASLGIRSNPPPRAIVGVPYSHAFRSDNGVGTVTWSVLSGALPAGLSLAPNGVLSGTPTSPVLASFTLQVSDAATPANVVSRVFALTVEADTVPAVDTAPLPSAQRGEPYNVALGVLGGNGPFTWTMLSGELPPGMEINANGDLLGTPGASGTYSFEVEVQELVPDHADSARATLTLQVAAAGDRTQLVPRSLMPIDLGAETETTPWPFWRAVAKQISGSPAHTAAFSALWDNFDLFIAVRVQDATPHAAGLTLAQADRVEIFLDAFHNREVVYNEDDRHITVTRDARLAEPSSRIAGMRHSVYADATGYSVIVAIPWSNLTIQDYIGLGIGFDVAVHDQRTGSETPAHLVWWGDAQNPGTTVNFGNLLLDDTLVGSGIQAPQRLTSFTITPTGDTSLRLNWVHPASATLEDYVLQRAVGAEAFSTVATLAQSVTSRDETGLTPGTTYRYRIQPRNRHSDGAWRLAAARSAPRQPFLESGGVIIMEAEHYESLDPKSDPTPYRFGNTAPGFAGSGYMETNNIASNNGTNWAGATELVYRFVVPSSGAYNALIRRIAASGADDSVFVGLDGNQIGTSQFANPASPWAWSGSLSLGTLSAGVHTLHLRKREDGMLIDRIALIRSGSSTPGGSAVGPAESLRGPAPGAPAPAASVGLLAGIGGDPLTAAPLTWGAAGGDVLVWHVERAAGSGAFVRVASLAPADQSWVDEGLSPGGVWRYRLVAANLSGEAVGPEFSITTAQVPALGITHTGASLFLDFATESAFGAQVETSTDLIDWTPLGSEWRSTGTQSVAVSMEVGPLARFYRLRVRRP